MTRILFVGRKPETVDYSDPSLPPGFDAQKINAGIAVAVDKIKQRGWEGETCMITPDDAGRATPPRGVGRSTASRLPPRPENRRPIAVERLYDYNDHLDHTLGITHGYRYLDGRAGQGETERAHRARPHPRPADHHP